MVLDHLDTEALPDVSNISRPEISGLDFDMVAAGFDRHLDWCRGVRRLLDGDYEDEKCGFYLDWQGICPKHGPIGRSLFWCKVIYLRRRRGKSGSQLAAEGKREDLMMAVDIELCRKQFECM